MAPTTLKIEVDAKTAATLEKRAAENGVSVPQLVAELAQLSEKSDDLAELERRWRDIEHGGETIPHEEVVRWLKTWGTPAYKPWTAR